MGRIGKILSLAMMPSAWKAAAITRTAAAVEHRSIVQAFRPKTLIDVGANKGQFSLLVRGLIGNEVKIYAFEPLPGEADIFERNFQGDSQCKLYRCALAERESTAKFHVASRADSSSLLPLAHGQRSAYGVVEAGTIDVPVRRLDEVIVPEMLFSPTMLKIDVQGAEDLVLRGATKLLKSLDLIYLEASFVELYANQKLAGEVISMVHELGFSLRGVGSASDTRHFGATQADLLFLRA